MLLLLNMNIIKPIGVIIRDKKYLVARDSDEDFFKNVGGRMRKNETELECLKRTLASDVGYTMHNTPELIFDFPPTPAQGDPGDFVILRGYLIEIGEKVSVAPHGDVSELAWINTKNQNAYKLTPQIIELILPRLHELGLID